MPLTPIPATLTRSIAALKSTWHEGETVMTVDQTPETVTIVRWRPIFGNSDNHILKGVPIQDVEMLPENYSPPTSNETPTTAAIPQPAHP